MGAGEERRRVHHPLAPTDAAHWQHSVRVPAPATTHVLKGIRVDDWMFGVSAVSQDGYESPVVSAVPGGAVRPYTAPPSQPR